MNLLDPLILANLAVLDGNTTPISKAGAIVWSTTASRLLAFNGTNWSSNMIPLDIAVGNSFDVSANTQQTAATTITIEGTLFVEGTVAFL